MRKQASRSENRKMRKAFLDKVLHDRRKHEGGCAADVSHIRRPTRRGPGHPKVQRDKSSRRTLRNKPGELSGSNRELPLRNQDSAALARLFLQIPGRLEPRGAGSDDNAAEEDQWIMPTRRRGGKEAKGRPQTAVFQRGLTNEGIGKA